jgi:hypothetical protein
MTRRLSALYPFLFIAVRLLFLADEHPGQYALADLLTVLVVALAGCAFIYMLATLALRDRVEARPLVTLVAVLWFFGLPEIGRWLQSGPSDPQFLAIVLLGLATSGLTVVGLAQRPRLLRTGATFLTITGTLLVVRFMVAIAADQVRARKAVAESALARELANPLKGAIPVSAARRDVYLLVLDEYANAAVLRERFGFDNSFFEDSLRALGFHIPSVVSSNYAHTILSLPSLLNAAHLYRAAQELPAGSTDPTLLNHLLERSRIVSYLKGKGYRYIFFPSRWWGSTRHSPLADSVVQVWPFSPAREFSRTEFRRVTHWETMLRYVNPVDRFDADHVQRTLEAFGRLPAVDGPVLAFAHVLSPHWPYVLDQNCGAASTAVALDQVAGYLGQLQCVNSVVLRTVTNLIRDSEVPPIILLQSDHGTATLRFSRAPSAELVPTNAARERFGAFGAYHLPDSGEVAFGDTVTVVNVLGNVLRHYFGVDLPRQPDDRYLSLERSPYEFHHNTEPLPSSSPRSAHREPRR